MSDRKIRQSNCSLLLASLAFVIATGCERSLVRADPPLAEVSQAPEAWFEAQKQVIAQRAQARWDALIDRNLDLAYEFLSPEYRSVFSIQQYRGGFGDAVRWNMARVKSVEYDSNNVARVVVEVDYTALVSLASEVRGSRQMYEKWVYLHGNWWYLSR